MGFRGPIESLESLVPWHRIRADAYHDDDYKLWIF
jgi:hypothetical protein